MRAQSDTVAAALARLRTAADRLAAAWPDMEWDGAPLSKPLVLSLGEFKQLNVEPGRELVLTSQLRPPRSLEGVALSGEPLDVMVDSIYPMDLAYEGASIFHESHPEVAPGPALVRAVEQLRDGDNGRMTLRVRAHDYGTWPWLRLRFSTPSLRRSFEALDVGWSQLALAAEVASGRRELAEVEAAAAVVMKGSLEPAGDPQVRERLEAAAAALTTVGQRVRKMKVHVVGHSHIDMNWLWTWPDTQAVILRDFATILALMDQFPEMTFTHSQAHTYEVIRQQAPKLFAKVRGHVAAGRWELATMQWVESDLNMVSGESLAQHLVHAVAYSRRHFGRSPAVFLAPDTFGHGGNVPQLVGSAGARAYYHHRCNPGGHDLWPAYWWEGDDGTRVLALSTPSYNGLITAAAVASAALRAHRNGLDTALLFHGVGDHGGGPTREGLEALRRFARLPCLPSAPCSTLGAHAQEVLRSRVRLPVHRGELNTIFEGCYTTHVEAKAGNRRAENELCTAQTLAALAGVDERERLDDAWRLVLFNQFHDIFCGSSIHEAYEQNEKDLERASSIAEAVAQKSLDRLETEVSGGDIVVTNQLGWDRVEVVVAPYEGPKAGAIELETPDGASIAAQMTADGLAFEARVAAFETKGYRVRPQKKEHAGVRVEGGPLYIAVETEIFKVSVHRPSGTIVSLRDKRVGRELVGYGTRRGSDYLDSARVDLGLNVFQLLDERFHEMSAWHLDEVRNETSLLEGAKTEIAESGPVRAVIKVARRFRQSSLEQRIVFYHRAPRIDFDTRIDWQEPSSPKKGLPNLKVAFNARLPQVEAWYESPNGASMRPADGQEVPALRWADVGGKAYGMALLNDSRYGHDALGSRLRMTLVRSAFDPDPNSDMGPHVVRFSLLPHPGDWRRAAIPRMAAAFNQPLIARRAAGPRRHRGTAWRPLVSGSPGVMLSALKRAHEGAGLVLRLNETSGAKGEAVVAGLPAGWRAERATVTEDRLATLAVRQGKLRVALRPWEVATIVVSPSKQR